jgi:hypothetical protein
MQMHGYAELCPIITIDTALGQARFLPVSNLLPIRQRSLPEARSDLRKVRDWSATCGPDPRELCGSQDADPMDDAQGAD